MEGEGEEVTEEVPMEGERVVGEKEVGLIEGNWKTGDRSMAGERVIEGSMVEKAGERAMEESMVGKLRKRSGQN